MEPQRCEGEEIPHRLRSCSEQGPTSETFPSSRTVGFRWERRLKASEVRRKKQRMCTGEDMPESLRIHLHNECLDQHMTAEGLHASDFEAKWACNAHTCARLYMQHFYDMPMFSKDRWIKTPQVQHVTDLGVPPDHSNGPNDFLQDLPPCLRGLQHGWVSSQETTVCFHSSGQERFYPASFEVFVDGSNAKFVVINVNGALVDIGAFHFAAAKVLSVVSLVFDHVLRS